MNGRRPHWDDDLIDSVAEAMPVYSDFEDRDLWAVIAAVEDWEKPSLDDLQRENLRDLVDAVQRVRELCDKRMTLADAANRWEGGFTEGWNHALDRLSEALDGPA